MIKNFILFSKKNNLELPKSFKLISNDIIIELNNDRLNRLFFNENKIIDKIENYFIYNYMYEFDTCISCLENCNYYSDCIEEIHNFLSENPEVIGSSSCKQNLIISKLLFEDKKDINNIKRIEQLIGENGWNSLKQYFDFLVLTDVKYVSLRKNEFLPKKFIEDDKDIDVLCENKKEFALISNAIKRSMGISGYKIKVANEWICLDIRYQGDFYFDPAWEKDIIEKRVLNQNNIYVIDEENQIFTILFHVLTQKAVISDYYINYLKKYYNNLALDHLLKNLEYFMKKKNYYFYKPLDKSVIQNKANIKYIKKHIINIPIRREIIQTLFSKFPHRLIPNKLKIYLFND